MANIKLEKAVERLITGDELNTKQINKKVTRVKTDGTPLEAGKQYMLDGDKDSFVEYVTPSTGGHITEITTGKVKDHLNEMFSAYESGGEAVLSLKTPSGNAVGVADNPLHYTGYKNAVLSSKLTTSTVRWRGLAISGTKTFFVNDRPNSWMTADYDSATGVFTNFQVLDLSSKLTASSDHWYGLTISGTKATFANYERNHWMTADYDPVAGTFSNFQVLDLSSKLTTASNGWYGLMISGTKAFFVQQDRDKWMTADYDSATGLFSNFQRLDLTSKLTTTDKYWYGLTIFGTKAVFIHYYSKDWMTADYDPVAGTFSNFKPIDLTSKLTTTTDVWQDMVVSGTKVFFINDTEGNWMTADAASIVHKDGEHYDIELMPYKKATTLHAVGDDILGDITKNKDYIEQDLGDGITSGGNPKLIIKH